MSDNFARRRVCERRVSGSEIVDVFHLLQLDTTHFLAHDFTHAALSPNEVTYFHRVPRRRQWKAYSRSGPWSSAATPERNLAESHCVWFTVSHRVLEANSETLTKRASIRSQ